MAIASEAYFTHLYQTYYQALCFFSLKMVGDVESAKDVVEEVFTKLILSKKEFTEPDNLRAWLYTATRNASLNCIKKDKHAKERQFEYSLGLEQGEGGKDYELMRIELLRKIWLELKALPGHSGKIIEMSYFRGMKNEAIAAELGLSEKTVRNLKSTGIATLKTKIPADLFLMLLVLAGMTGWRG